MTPRLMRFCPMALHLWTVFTVDEKIREGRVKALIGTVIVLVITPKGPPSLWLWAHHDWQKRSTHDHRKACRAGCNCIVSLLVEVYTFGNPQTAQIRKKYTSHQSEFLQFYGADIAHVFPFLCLYIMGVWISLQEHIYELRMFYLWPWTQPIPEVWQCGPLARL